MDTVIVTTESQLITIIENAVGKFFKVETQKVKPDNISGTKEAVIFLCENGYEISESLFTKQTAKRQIPCKRLHNKRLLFSKKELIAWAESKYKPVTSHESETQRKLRLDRYRRNTYNQTHKWSAIWRAQWLFLHGLLLFYSYSFSTSRFALAFQIRS